MKIAIAADHGGVLLKQELVGLLGEMGHEVEDLGTTSTESVDYPDYAREVCSRVSAGVCARGILLCGTGVGMSMVANRIEGIRAALCNDLFTARLSREHNDANVLCLGARIVGPGLAAEIVKTWIGTDFAGGRHQRRIAMF